MTDAMSAKRRFLAALLGGRVDRPAVGSPTSVATVAQMALTGAGFPKAHLDAEAMARLAAGAHEILGYDAIAPIYSVDQEAAALGCEMDWGTVDSMPTARSHPWAAPDDVRIPYRFLHHPAISTALDAIRLLRHRYPDVAIVGKMMGPWTLAYHMHGIEAFLIETVTEPDTVRRFLDRLKVVPLLFGRAQIAAGADVLCLADHATGDLVRGAMYRDFLAPIHQELVADLGCPIILHICGNTLDRIGYIADAGFDAFHFESKVDAVAAVSAAGGRMSLMGNINNPTTLYTGTTEEVVAEARQALRAGVQVLGPECAIPLHTPIANLRAIAEVAKQAR